MENREAVIRPGYGQRRGRWGVRKREAWVVSWKSGRGSTNRELTPFRKASLGVVVLGSGWRCC